MCKDDDEDDDESALQALKNLHLGGQSSSQSKSTPARKPAARSTPTRKLSFPSSVASISTLSATKEDLVEGSEKNPFKYTINKDYPEKNPARIPFCFLPDHDHEGHTYRAWKLKATIPHHDYNSWDAYFEKPNCIKVKAPSLSYYEKKDRIWNPELHDVKDRNAHPFHLDEATRKADAQLEAAIKKDQAREYNWWKFEIPGVVLDNSILSGASRTKIKKEPRPMTAERPHKDLKGAVAVWIIAEAGGIQVETENVEDDVLNM